MTEKKMKLKSLINLIGGPARCADIWGITRESVSRIIKRNSINRGLLFELRNELKKTSHIIDTIIDNKIDTEFFVTDRKTNRRKKTKTSKITDKHIDIINNN